MIWGGKDKAHGTNSSLGVVGVSRISPTLKQTNKQKTDGCLRIELNLNTMYLEVVQWWRIQSTKIIFHNKDQLQTQSDPYTANLLVINTMISLEFHSFGKVSQNSQKQIMYWAVIWHKWISRWSRNPDPSIERDVKLPWSFGISMWWSFKQNFYKPYLYIQKYD